MAGCAPGLQSIRLGGPVTVMSLSRASTAAGDALSRAVDAGLALAAAATSCADAGWRPAAARGSCRGVSSGLPRAPAALSLPGDLGNNGNAIGFELAVFTRRLSFFHYL